VIRVVLVVAVAAAAVIALNVVLLNQAAGGNDPVGRLRPRLDAPAAPATVVRPPVTKTTEHENEGADD
jgi:hypothetical protein